MRVEGAFPRVSTRSRRATLVGIFISLIGFILLAYLFFTVYYLLGLPRGTIAILNYTLGQLVSFIILLYIIRLEGNDFKSVFYGDRGIRIFLISLACFIITLLTWPLVQRLCEMVGIEMVNWQAKTPIRGPLDIAVISIWTLSAAFFEEFFYRGYAVTRIYALTGSLKLALLIQYIFFVAIHLPYFGLAVTICMAVWTAILTLLLIYTKSVWATFYYHLVNNAVVYVSTAILGLWG